MQKFNGSLIRQFPSLVTGNAAAGVQVSVFIAGGNTLATLYATNNTAGVQLSNPLTTDGNGFYSFYAADGKYVLEFNNGFPSLAVQLVDVDAIRNDFDALEASNTAFRNEQQAAYDAFVLSQGWDQVGTFAAGFTYTSPNQVGQDADGNWWRWAGTIPAGGKTVTAGTLPTSDANYKLVGDGVLRSALAAPDSTVLVGGVEAGDLYSYGLSAIGESFKTKLDSGQSDAKMLVISDSTGNEQSEWVYKYVLALVAAYPEHTFNYRLWDDATSAYLAPVVFTGSGSKVVDVYNAAHPGASATYFQGARFNLINAAEMDFVITNLGHNGGTNLTYRTIFEIHFQCFMEYKNRHPKADFAITLQNFRTDSELYSATAVDVLRDIAKLLSAPVIDIYTIFKQKQKAGELNEWMVDIVHPNSAGSDAWARTVVNQFFYGSDSVQSKGALISGTGDSLLNDPYMLDFPWNLAGPTGTTVSNATVGVETTIQESGRAIKVTATSASNGFIRWDLTPTQLKSIKHLNSVTFAVRLYVPAASTNALNGRVYYDASGSQYYTALAVARDGWLWSMVTVPKSVLQSATFLRLGVFVTDNSSIYIDRVIALPNDDIKEPRYTDIILSEYYSPLNVVGLDTTLPIVSGNNIQITTSSTPVGDYRFAINLPSLPIGTRFILSFNYDATVGSVFARSGLNGGGTTIASTNSASTSLEFVTTTSNNSILVTMSTGEVLPKNFNNVSIKVKK